MSKFTVQWKLGASDPCPICRGLSGHVWTFHVRTGLPEILLFQGKPVWNLQVADHSLAHGKSKYNCRCHLEYSFTLQPYLDDLTRLSHEGELFDLKQSSRGFK